MALRITYGDTSYLICGDAEQQSEMDMIRSGVYLDADVYVVSHHGSSTSSSDAFLDAMTPTYALISCGANNEYGHPSMEALQRLRNHGCAMFRTDKQGTVVAASDGTEIWFNAAPCEDWTAGNQIILLEGTDGEAAGETFRQMPEEGTDGEAAGETVLLMPEEGTGGEQTGGVTREIPAEEAEPSYQYVCNTNTKKFHYPNCKSVDQMKEEHRLYTDLSRDDLIAQGYAPCGNCNP